MGKFANEEIQTLFRCDYEGHNEAVHDAEDFKQVGKQIFPHFVSSSHPHHNKILQCDNCKWCPICVVVIGHLILTEKSGCGHSWMGAVPELVLRSGIQGMVAGRFYSLVGSKFIFLGF